MISIEADEMVKVRRNSQLSPPSRAGPRKVPELINMYFVVILVSSSIGLLTFAASTNPRDEGQIQLGYLDQHTTSLDMENIAPEQKLRTIRLSSLNSRRITPGDQSRQNSSESMLKRQNNRGLEEALSIDCLAKRNEVLNRQISGASSGTATRSPSSHILSGFQKLRPKHQHSPTSGISNDTTIHADLNDGEHVPRCNQQGGYEPVQCHKIGYCWCVNKYGQAIKNSAVLAGEEPYCDPRMYDSDSNDLLVVAGISAQRIKNLLKSHSTSTESSTPNGNINFEAEPPTEATDIDGHQQVGGDHSNRRIEPTLPLIPNDCKSSQANAKERASSYMNDSIWVPECDITNDRLYSLKQCHRSVVCWCVDQITGLPLKTTELISSKPSVNCTEIKRIVDLANSMSRANKPLPSFYHGSSEFCDADKRVEFMITLNNQFRQQINDYIKQNSAHSSLPPPAPPGFTSNNPLAVDEVSISKWKFTLMDKDSDGKLGDREWSKFKNNFKLVDKPEDLDQPPKQKSIYFSLSPLLILRSQRKCWRDFLEFCGDGELLNDESISLTKWLSCTDLPPKSLRNNNEEKQVFGSTENTYAHSREAAIVRSKKKNPFLGILKAD